MILYNNYFHLRFLHFFNLIFAHPAIIWYRTMYMYVIWVTIRVEKKSVVILVHVILSHNILDSLLKLFPYKSKSDHFWRCRWTTFSSVYFYTSFLFISLFTGHIMVQHCLSVIDMSDINSKTLKPIWMKLWFIVYIYWLKLLFYLFLNWDFTFLSFEVFFIKKGDFPVFIQIK